MQHFRVHVFSMQIISQLNLSFDMLITALLLKKMIKTSWIVAYHDPSLLLPISCFNLSYTEEIWCWIYVEFIFTQKLLVIYLWNLHIELNMTFSFLSRKTEIVLSCKTYLYNHCFIYNLKKHFFFRVYLLSRLYPMSRWNFVCTESWVFVIARPTKFWNF